MDKTIKELLAQGLGRDEIFERLRTKTGNEMRLAEKIATIDHGRPSVFFTKLNYVLLAICLIQSSLAVWATYYHVVPLDESFGWLGIAVIVLLTVLYFIGLAKLSFKGYASFVLFCVMATAHYVYFFSFVPVISIVGVLLAVSGGALSYTMKVRLFPHMGFMGARKDEAGEYIFE